jgi:uncharacterized protein YkwD
MGRLSTRGWVIGALLVVAVLAVSASALVFQGRDAGSRGDDRATTTTREAHRRTATSSTTSTTTTSTTTSTTTTVPPAPAPTEPPAPIAVVPPPPPPPPVCDGGGSGVVDAMNGDRASAGLGALCSSSQLAGYAQSWANWMAQNLSLTHQDLNNVLAGTTFNRLAENLLSGPSGMSVGEMEAAWMASPSHRQNIMNGAYSAAGVGIAHSGDGRVWVAVEFGG